MDTALRAIAPRQRVRGSVQPSAAQPSASNSRDNYYNRDLPPLPREESDLSESSQASSLESVTNSDAITEQNSEWFERDSEFWFEDGNVIVVIENTAFRFHECFVSPHSSIFRDLLSSPRPSSAREDAHETFDGCPVVRVSDTSYDFRELLRALYDGIKYLDPNQTMASSVLFALARLSHKYQFDELFAAIIYRLERIFPTRLKFWDQAGGVDGGGPNRLSSVDAIEALNLFRLIDRPGMLTTALYRCGQLEPHSILHGAKRMDGVTRELLSPSDMVLCMKIKEELMQATTSLLTRLYEACDDRLTQLYDNPDCPRPRACRRGLRTVMSIFLEHLREGISTDPLDMRYISAAASSSRDEEMCHECGRVLERAYMHERRRIWAKLPELMGI